MFEHITTKQAAHYVRDAATSGKKYDCGNHYPSAFAYESQCDFCGRIRPHNYCLPVLKREEHCVALLEAATSGNPRFFLVLIVHHMPRVPRKRPVVALAAIAHSTH